jgi:cytochrome c-type biogenesis protein CcmH
MTRWFVLLLLILPLGPALAQADDTPAEVIDESAARPSEEEISARSLHLFVELMSPYCPGATLRDCGSGQAATLRDRIREQIRSGQTDQEIVDALVVEFGETILSKPKFKGFGMVAYIAPIAALLIGIFALVGYLKRQKPQPIAAADEPAHPSTRADASHLRRKLEDELRLRTGG